MEDHKTADGIGANRSRSDLNGADVDTIIEPLDELDLEPPPEGDEGADE
jgi:hypothetical protein